MKQRQMFQRRRQFALLAVALVGAFLLFLQREPLLSSAGRWLNVSSGLQQPVDCVMVLGGGASTRPFVAAEIVRCGLARKVLVPQFHASEGVQDGIAEPEDELICGVLLHSGVPSDAIDRLEAVVDSTQAEAECLAAYLQDNPATTVAVVTSDYHTRRTRRLFSRACRGRAESLRFIGAPTDGFRATNWWKSEDGVVAYANEYVKLGSAIAADILSD